MNDVEILPSVCLEFLLRAAGLRAIGSLLLKRAK
jgi:hypothetical protein